jgi:hypothetical protein
VVSGLTDVDGLSSLSSQEMCLFTFLPFGNPLNPKGFIGV